MNDLLTIGASGLRAYRASLAATGDNIANATVKGYARRSVQLNEVAITGAPDFRYRNRVRFDGVDTGATIRAADAWRTSDARLAASADGRARAISDWMTAAETALPDSDTGTGAALSGLFASGDRLSADPFSRAPRSAFLNAVDTTAASIRRNADDLARTATGIGEAAASAAAALGDSLAALADLNLAIRRAGAGTTSHAELSDQRDRLIDAIAERTGIVAMIGADGSATLTHGAQTLVSGGTATPLTLSIAADGRISYELGGAAYNPDGGTLAGLQAAAAAVAGKRSLIDTLASDLATALNAWHAAGRTPGNGAGPALLDASGGAAALVALVTDPQDVAAADTSGAANGNMLALQGARTASGVEASWAAIVANQAQDTASARDAADRTTARRETADAARDMVEGVDLDREAADLLRFQQAYQASARVIQMAKETVDTILRLF